MDGDLKKMAILVSRFDATSSEIAKKYMMVSLSLVKFIVSIILKLYSPRYPVNITFSRRGRSAKS